MKTFIHICKSLKEEEMLTQLGVSIALSIKQPKCPKCHKVLH